MRRKSSFSIRNDWKSLAKAYIAAGGSRRVGMWITKSGGAYHEYLSHLKKHHGAAIMFKVLKVVELIVEDICVGRKDRPVRALPFFTKRDNLGGMPSRLSPLRVLASMRSRAAKSLALSIASSFRALNITLDQDKFPRAELTWKPWTIDWALLEDGMERLHRKVGNIRPRHQLPPRDFWRSSASVHASVAIMGAAHDARVLLHQDEGLVSLRELWLAAIPRSTPEEWEDWLSGLERLALLAPVKWPKRRGKAPPLTLARFTWVPDRGGKLRGVTPANYHVQNILRPIHDFLMHCLERTPTDCTYDEQKSEPFICEFTRKVEPRHGGGSSDIPDATTQFPPEISARVAAKFLGRSVEKPFYRMLRLPVWFGEGRERGMRPFARGAPMGVYTLWPAFTLAHHSIIQGCAQKAARALQGNGGWYSRYRVRGDDNFIADRPVMVRYVGFWNGLNQPPGSDKSVLPWVTGVVFAKFAKRVFFKGRVLRPFTYGELAASRHFTPTSALDFVKPIMAGRGHSRKEPLALPAFLSALLGGRSRAARKRLEQALKALRVLRITSDLSHGGATVVTGVTVLPAESMMEIRETLNGRIKEDLQGTLYGIWRSLFPDDPPPSPLHAIDVAVRSTASPVKRPVKAKPRKGSLAPPSRLKTIGETPRKRPSDLSPKLGAVFKGHVHPSALCPSGLEDHPVFLRLHRLAAELSKAEEFVKPSREVYQGSKAIREVQELLGISEFLRRANRRTTRLRLLSRYEKMSVDLHQEHASMSEVPGFGRFLNAMLKLQGAVRAGKTLSPEADSLIRSLRA